MSVVGADGKAADREVKVGVMNRVSAQIVSGLEPGEKVVIGTKAPRPRRAGSRGASRQRAGAEPPRTVSARAARDHRDQRSRRR